MKMIAMVPSSLNSVTFHNCLLDRLGSTIIPFNAGHFPWWKNHLMAELL